MLSFVNHHSRTSSPKRLMGLVSSIAKVLTLLGLKLDITVGLKSQIEGINKSKGIRHEAPAITPSDWIPDAIPPPHAL